LAGKYFKKLIAPAAVAIVCVLYYIFFGYIITGLDIPDAIKIIGMILPVIIIVMFISAFAERIKEIWSGEEDDIGKY
jgi:uncharacterized RDD family membrane protein YckC